MQYAIAGRTRRMVLGSLAMLDPSKARETAKDLLAKVRLGGDPAGEKIEGRARAAETMGAVLESYLTHQRQHLRPRSYVEVERHLRKHCRQLHGLQLAKIDRRAVAARIAAIAAKSGAVAANRTRASLQAFFAWCLREGLAESNPVVGTGRQPERSRERTLERRGAQGDLGRDRRHRRLFRHHPFVAVDRRPRVGDRRLALVGDP